jgi:hypothetical protein
VALRQLADEVQAGPLSLQQVQADNARILGDWDTLAAQAAPGYARLAVQLSDAQVAEMIQRIGKEMERKSRKRSKLSPEKHRQHLIDDMEDSLDDWIGRPDAAQRQLVEQWAGEAADAVPEAQRLQTQLARLGRYEALLASRAQPGFEDRVRAYFNSSDDDGRRMPERREQARRLQLFADLSQTLQPEQRQHLRQRLLGYAADFEALVAEPPARGPETANP